MSALQPSVLVYEVRGRCRFAFFIYYMRLFWQLLLDALHFQIQDLCGDQIQILLSTPTITGIDSSMRSRLRTADIYET
jgi:hypothetical protein